MEYDKVAVDVVDAVSLQLYQTVSYPDDVDVETISAPHYFRDHDDFASFRVKLCDPGVFVAVLFD